MAEWLKIDVAAKQKCGGIHTRHLYRAIREGKLRAARYGRGRNVLTTAEWCDQWLEGLAAEGTRVERSSRGQFVEVPRPATNHGGPSTVTTAPVTPPSDQKTRNQKATGVTLSRPRGRGEARDAEIRFRGAKGYALG